MIQTQQAHINNPQVLCACASRLSNTDTRETMWRIKAIQYSTKANQQQETQKKENS